MNLLLVGQWRRKPRNQGEVCFDVTVEIWVWHLLGIGVFVSSVHKRVYSVIACG